MLGIINYVWSIIRVRQPVTGRLTGKLYAFMQFLITFLYLSPVIAVSLYGLSAYLDPSLFPTPESYHANSFLFFGIRG